MESVRGLDARDWPKSSVPTVSAAAFGAPNVWQTHLALRVVGAELEKTAAKTLTRATSFVGESLAHVGMPHSSVGAAPVREGPLGRRWDASAASSELRARTRAADGRDARRLPRLRSSAAPLRWCRYTIARTVGHAIVGGARSHYVREVDNRTRSVGAQLHPGAAPLLLGVPADELAERHTRLDDLWGRAAIEMRERLADAGDPERQLDVFASLLATLPTKGLQMKVHQLFAYIAVKNAAKAIEFYIKAFGANEKLRLDGTVLMLLEEFPEYGIKAPDPLAASSSTIHLHVDNADEMIGRAVAAGAELVMEPRD